MLNWYKILDRCSRFCLMAHVLISNAGAEDLEMCCAYIKCWAQKKGSA